MKKILLTGATGYIGRNFIKKCSIHFEIFAVIRKSSDLSKISQYLDDAHIIFFEKISEDIRLLDNQFDVYVNLMGYFVTQHTQENIDQLVGGNYLLPLKVWDVISNNGCKHIITLGSYWQNCNGKNYDPVNLYAAIKQSLYDSFIYYVKVKDCKLLELKIFDTYGPDDDRGKVLNLIKNLAPGGSIDMTDCTQKVYYCYIDDIISAIECSINSVIQMESGEAKTYVLRDVMPIQLKDIIDRVVLLRGGDITVNFGKREKKERETFDPTGIGTVLPQWKPQVDYEQGIRRFLFGGTNEN